MKKLIEKLIDLFCRNMPITFPTHHESLSKPKLIKFYVVEFPTWTEYRKLNKARAALRFFLNRWLLIFFPGTNQLLVNAAKF